MRKKILILIFFVSVIFTSCSNSNQKSISQSDENSLSVSQSESSYEPVDDSKIDKMNFEQIKKEARGKTVNFYGYGQDLLRNDFIDNVFAPYVKEKYNVNVNRVSMDIDAINTLMLNEKQANKASDIDVVWINGENFYSDKKEGLLYGPFTKKLENFNKYVDTDTYDTNYDFAYPIDGYEAPYGKAQLVLVYNSNKITIPPKNLDELKEWIKKNPGKFTYPQMPDFTGSAFFRTVIANLVGYEEFMDFDKEYDKDQLKKDIKPAIDYLNDIKGYLWNKGESYPSDLATLNNMFKDGEVYMTISYNPSWAASQIANKSLSKNTKTFVFDDGTVGNTNFLAIAKGSKNKSAAMVMIDAMLSFDMQFEKSLPQVLGDMPVYDINKLSNEEKNKIRSENKDTTTLSTDYLLEHRIPEMPAKLVPIFEEIWNEEVLNK